jgi:rhodopsin domain-containing protein
MVAAGALSNRGVHWGLGRHVYYLSPEQITNSLKYVVFMTAPGIFGIALGRASFCLFLLSTIGAEKRVRMVLWITLVLQMLVNVTAIILLYSSCGRHIAAVWDISIQAKCIPFTPISYYLYFLGGLCSFLLAAQIMH